MGRSKDEEGIMLLLFRFLFLSLLPVLVLLCHQQSAAENAANHEPWC